MNAFDARTSPAGGETQDAPDVHALRHGRLIKLLELVGYVETELRAAGFSEAAYLAGMTAQSMAEAIQSAETSAER